MTHKTFTCNLCRGSIKQETGSGKYGGFAVTFTTFHASKNGKEGIKISQFLTQAEHHICDDCLRALRSASVGEAANLARGIQFDD